MIVKLKESFEKKQGMLKKTTNLKGLYYEDREIQDIMKKYYQIKINLIISILFLMQHNRILSRLVVHKKAFDISRKRSHPRPTPTTQQNYKNTNPRV